jgi:indolepyruvate ferredoxin oxidoreductase beta subunit
VLLSFEQMEALRYHHWLRPGGLLIYNILRVNPATVAGGFASYPEDVPARIEAAWDNVLPVDGTKLATEAGNVRAANMALLGAISGSMPFSMESWKAVIEKVVPPKTIEANLKAFDLGRAVGREAGAAIAR